MLTVAYGEATLDRSNVYRWYKMFSEGREDVNDEERAGRPSTSTTDEKINEVEKMILANRRITVREVAEDLNISIGSCHSIFINDLGMRRVAAKFVPKLLNCDQKQHRMNIANEMLDSVRDDPNLLQRVITGDEAWVYGYDVETKAQLSQWKLPHEPRPKKARQIRSNVKVLLTVFFDYRGVVHHEFLPQGRTVTKEYCLQVMRNLREAIRQKRPDLWKNKNWLLHHDNALAHTSLLVRDLLAKNNTYDAAATVFPRSGHLRFKVDEEPTLRWAKSRKTYRENKINKIEENIVRNDNLTYKYILAKNETAVNIHPNLVSVYGEGSMSILMVCRWRSWFLEGQKNVRDDERSGRPVLLRNNAAVAAVRNVVEADRRVTIDEIMIRLPPGIEIGRSSIGTIMPDVLNFRKVCARWVPRLLSENHRQQRMEAARAFLEMHRRDGDQLFSRIVTGDESWVHHSTPETKRQSMVWKKPEESAPKKAKVTISAGKVMAIVFWDCKGVLLVDYLPPNTTVNAARYCEVLTKLRAAIKRKRSGLLSRKVLLVHDNARPHAARKTQTLLENFKWEIFTHPPYSPELAPSDFHLFPALKLHFGGKHFANDDEVQAEANHWFEDRTRLGTTVVSKYYYNGTNSLDRN
ncbi:hypothetical protein LAZ67_4004295, partial [Cordylochernes scorpioides]